MKRIILLLGFLVLVLVGVEGWGQGACGTPELPPFMGKFFENNISSLKNARISSTNEIIWVAVKPWIVRKGNDVAISSSNLKLFIDNLNESYLSSNVQFYSLTSSEINSSEFNTDIWKMLYNDAEENYLGQNEQYRSDNAINLYFIEGFYKFVSPEMNGQVVKERQSTLGLAPFTVNEIQNNNYNVIKSDGKSIFNEVTKNGIYIAGNSISAGKTILAHEIGHYFGLFHTHQNARFKSERDNSSTGGDFISDTNIDLLDAALVNPSNGYTYLVNTLTENCAYSNVSLKKSRTIPITNSWENPKFYSNKSEFNVLDIETNTSNEIFSESKFGNPPISNIMSYYTINATPLQKLCSNFSGNFTPLQRNRIQNFLQHRLTLIDAYNIQGSVPQPTNLSGKRIGNSIYLAWQIVGNDQIGLILERSTSPNTTFTKIAELPFNRTTYQDEDLPLGITYYYRVRVSSTDSDDFIEVGPHEATPGITVITHGFQALGKASDDIPKWMFDQAIAVKNRAGGGVILKNNPLSGHWEVVSSGDYSKEIILCYNWAFASGRVPLLNNETYKGNIQASSDHLFGLLHSIPNITLIEMKTRPKHFIGHSRGGVLMIELANHFLKRYPDINIEHLTLLDPHPAIPMEDINLSYVEPDGDRYKLRIPANVIKADNYYRNDLDYEGSLLSIESFSFDGVPLIGAQNVLLDDEVIKSQFLSVFSGGAHSNVHAWYYFTQYLGSLEKYDGSISYPPVWYGNETYYDFSAFGQESRFQAGFNHSRIGGGLNLLQSIPTAMKINSTYNPPLIFNSTFSYNKVGWDYNSGQLSDIANEVIIENEKLVLKFKKSATSLVGRKVRHANFLFPSNKNSLSFIANTELNNALVYPTLITRFFNSNGLKISEIEKLVNNQNSLFNVGIPAVLQGKFGTFEVEFKSNEIASIYYDENSKIILDNFDLIDFIFLISPPTITASKTSISGGQSVLLTTTGCANGTVNWSNEQSGAFILVSPLETTGYTASCALDGFNSTPSNAVVITVNYSHTLSNGEYFFDTDPGFGNGFALPITGTPSILNQTFNINLVPHNLSQGVHTLGVRVRDNKNDWSLTHTRPFLVLGVGSGISEKITQVQYFYDSLKTNQSNLVTTNVNPGAGGQIALPLSVSLSQGVHTISVRAKDNTGRYSLFHTRPFLVLGVGAGISENITQVQYFYDSLKTNQSNLVTTNVNPGAGGQIALPLSMSLSQGVHTISVRAKDNTGRYSLFHTRPFLVLGIGTAPSAISKIEYFLDADPGFGNGTQVPYSASGNNAAQVSLDLGAVPAGVHTVFVRVLDSGGRWSLTHVRPFMVMPNLGNSAGSIARIEYFINQPDPGQGGASSVSFSPVGGSDVTALFDANLAGLGNGTHRLHARAQDNAGSWSALNSVAFDIVCAANGLYFTIKSGSWNDPSVWNCGTVPSVMEAARISTDHVIALPANYTATAKSVELRGSLQYNANAWLKVGQE